SDLTCLTCHAAPHGAGAGAEVKKPKGMPASEIADASCKTCHADVAQKGREHTHHRAATCVSCHMPPTVSGVLDHFADHPIDVPNRTTTARHNGPNACGVCHKDKPVADLQASFASFWPTSSARTRRRTRLADAFDHETAASSRESLIGVANDPDEAPSLRGAA